LFSQDRGVIFADAVPAVATTPPTVIAAAKSAAIALRRMLSPFMGWFSAAEFLLPARPLYRSNSEDRYTKRVAGLTSRELWLLDYGMSAAATPLYV
jgi:hypothetical protein